MPEWKDFFAAVVALIASFAGAWAAFRFESRRRADDIRRKNIGAGNRSIYGVYALWNVLEQFRKEVLEPCRGRPDAWLNLSAHPTAPTVTDRFQTADLQFLLEQGKAEIFASIMLEEQRFNLAIDLIRVRSELVLNAVFPRMAAAGFMVGQPQNQVDVEEALGVDLCHKLKQITAAIFQNVDEDIASLRSLYTNLRRTLQTLYPEHEFLQIIFEEESKAQHAKAATAAQAAGVERPIFSTEFPSIWLLAHLSFTRFLIDHFKESSDPSNTGWWLRRWNWGWFAIEFSLAVALVWISRQSVASSWPELVRVALCLVAFWRINEIAYAFYRDGLSKIRGDADSSDVPMQERVGMLLRSAFGLAVQFAVLYYLLLPAQGFKESFNDFRDALYLSAATMTSIGQEGQEVQSHLMRLLHIYQSGLTIVLFVIALATYVGGSTGSKRPGDAA